MRRTFGDRFLAADGPHETCLTLAWLATHRGRLRSLVVGGHRLSLLLVWDDKGRQEVDHDDAEVAALTRVVYGPRPIRDATCDVPPARPICRDAL